MKSEGKVKKGRLDGRCARKKEGEGIVHSKGKDGEVETER